MMRLGTSCLLLLFAKAVRLTPGSRVTIEGLTDRTDLNGCVGRHEISLFDRKRVDKELETDLALSGCYQLVQCEAWQTLFGTVHERRTFCSIAGSHRCYPPSLSHPARLQSKERLISSCSLGKRCA